MPTINFILELSLTGANRGFGPAPVFELIFHNAARDGRGHKSVMTHPPAIFDRLLAHARICQDIADATMNSETAGKLEVMAQDCLQVARDADPDAWNQMFPPAAGSPFPRLSPLS
jgi:hypothetical protein